MISKPNVSVTKLSEVSVQENTAQKILVVAGKTSAGSAASGALKQRMVDVATAEALFGARSQAADMIREILKLNSKTHIDAIGISDNGAIAAHGTVTFHGTETATGTITVTVNAVPYALTVGSGVNAYDAAAALALAITNDGTAAVTAVQADNVVTITAKATGTGGNAYNLLGTTDTVTGLTWALSGALLTGGSTAGTAAAGVIAMSGTATATGVITCVIGSSVNRSYAIPVTVNMTAAQFSAALAAEIALDTKAPFTGSDNSGTLTITMANAGVEGNRTLLKMYNDHNYVGLSWTLTGFTGGAGTPTMTSVLDACGNARYQTIVAPYGLGSAYLTTFLEARWNIDNAILDGVAVLCNSLSYGDMITLGGTLNKKTLCLFGDKLLNETDHKGPANAEFDYIKAAQFAALRALRLTAGADISAIVTSSVGSLDNVGGPAIASLPYFNTPMANLPIYEDEYPGFTGVEVDALRDVGISCFGNNVANNAVICGEVVSTYKTDSSGAVDTTWKFLETVDTASNAAEYIFNNLKADYSQSRLTTGDLIPGRAMANEESIAAGFVGYYQALSGPDYVLCQAGEDALNYLKRNLDVVIDMTVGSSTITGKLPLVTQLRSIVVPLKMVLVSVN